MSEYTHTYSVETSKSQLKAIFLMDNGKLFLGSKRFYLEFVSFKTSKLLDFWDNFSYIEDLYKDLKKGKKGTSRLKDLKKSLDLVNREDSHVEALTKKDVKKFLKEVFKIIKVLNDKQTT